LPWGEEALAASSELAAQCDLSLLRTVCTAPQVPLPAGHTPTTWLRQLCAQGLTARYGEARPAAPPAAPWAAAPSPAVHAHAPSPSPSPPPLSLPSSPPHVEALHSGTPPALRRHAVHHAVHHAVLSSSALSSSSSSSSFPSPQSPVTTRRQDDAARLPTV